MTTSKKIIVALASFTLTLLTGSTVYLLNQSVITNADGKNADDSIYLHLLERSRDAQASNDDVKLENR